MTETIMYNVFEIFTIAHTRKNYKKIFEFSKSAPQG